MKASIAVLAGDGIGPEIMAAALHVLAAVEKRFGHEFKIQSGDVGGAAYERFGKHLPPETLQLCRGSDAVLFAAVGGPLSQMHLAKWRNCEVNSILALRQEFKFHANFRPVQVSCQLTDLSPLKPELLADVDMLIVRELLGDCYFGEKQTSVVEGRRRASDLSVYDEAQIALVAHCAFQAAGKRRCKVTSVDKANVLETSRLWRKVVQEISAQYPEVTLEEMLVDNCAMQLIRNPGQFDVLLTSNMFGDILSDAAAVIPGSLGLMPSASINGEGFALYEPIAGSAPDIAGLNKANPIAQIACLSWMFRLSFGLEQEAIAVEEAVQQVLQRGLRTADIYRQAESTYPVGTKQMAQAVAEQVIRKKNSFSC